MEYKHETVKHCHGNARCGKINMLDEDGAKFCLYCTEMIPDQGYLVQVLPPGKRKRVPCFVGKCSCCDDIAFLCPGHMHLRSKTCFTCRICKLCEKNYIGPN